MQPHAAVTVDGRDRMRLERLCRYLLRPPFGRRVDHVSSGSCMGCHASAMDFSFIWLGGVDQVVALGE